MRTVFMQLTTCNLTPASSSSFKCCVVDGRIIDLGQIEDPFKPIYIIYVCVCACAPMATPVVRRFRLSISKLELEPPNPNHFNSGTATCGGFRIETAA